MDVIYLWVVKHRNQIVRTFFFLNVLLAFIWYVAYRTIIGNIGDPSWFYRNGQLFGQIGIVLYVITTLPGIMRRFSRFSKPVSIIMMFRRYIGIMTFLFIFLHASIERFFWIIKGVVPLMPTPVFQVFGVLGFILLFALFITSNDWSVSKLGKWWHVIHNLTYIAAWAILAHVALQRLSIWTMLIGVDALMILSSHGYAMRKRSTNA